MKIGRAFVPMLAGIALAAGACRDQGPQAFPTTQLYSLESIGGRGLPYRVSDPASQQDFVTVQRAVVELRGARVEHSGPAGVRNELMVRTTARVERRSADGRITEVAHGEAEEVWLYERAGTTILPYRVIEGSRVEAPFRFAADERSLVMHSDQPALSDWRFVR